MAPPDQVTESLFKRSDVTRPDPALCDAPRKPASKRVREFSQNEVLLPGEPEQLARRERTANGIPMASATWTSP